MTRFFFYQLGRLSGYYLDTLVKIHALDPVELKLDFLAMPELGTSPLDQELAFYGNFYSWA